jgi:hypothetical protein
MGTFKKITDDELDYAIQEETIVNDIFGDTGDAPGTIVERALRELKERRDQEKELAVKFEA